LFFGTVWVFDSLRFICWRSPNIITYTSNITTDRQIIVVLLWSAEIMQVWSR
jgi:hypothetical protein